MKIKAEFKDLEEFLAFVRGKGIDIVEIHDENGPVLEVPTEEPVQDEVPEDRRDEYPTEEPAEEEITYSLDELQRVAASLLTKDKALGKPLKAKLREYGAEVMRDLPTNHYADFAGFLKELGGEV